MKMDKPKIVFAPQTLVDTYAPEVERILEAIGHPEAWASDESLFADFMFDEGELDALLGPLGLAGISDSTPVHEAAKMLRDAAQNGANLSH